MSYLATQKLLASMSLHQILSLTRELYTVLQKSFVLYAAYFSSVPIPWQYLASLKIPMHSHLKCRPCEYPT